MMGKKKGKEEGGERRIKKENVWKKRKENQ